MCEDNNSKIENIFFNIRGKLQSSVERIDWFCTLRKYWLAVDLIDLKVI